MKATWLLLGLALSLTACNKIGGVSASSIKTDDEKVIYALGANFGERLKPYELTAAEQKILLTGVADSLAGSQLKAEVPNIGLEINKFADKRTKAIADKERDGAKAYIEKMQKEEGAEVTATGIVFKEIQAGSGDTPSAEDTVKVNYHGQLRDGTVFDSSIEKLDGPLAKEPSPMVFPLNRVIPCWTEAVQKIKVGGKAKVTCPSDLAYGDRGAPPKIKPGAPLTFEIELLEILKTN
ncbi:MAG: FKBP-type peptidyl-prolyl cis-trans isomerase [Bdellovibrionaceae bacterium]|nr:FKBP-type peptidyl-prolyl cis-trans isomerase [Pseudobdellovibrionaceae bacterium]